MFRNYLKIAFRNFRKYKGFTFINLFGLVVGLTASILILVYIRFERNYDRYNENADNIFRVYHQGTMDGRSYGYARTPGPLAKFLQEEYPQIEKTVRIFPVG